MAVMPEGMAEKAKEARELAKRRLQEIIEGIGLGNYTVAQIRRLKELAISNPGRAAGFEKVFQGKASMRQCLNLKCLDCSCWQPSEITGCPVTDCPLYQLRPYQRSSDEDIEEQEEKGE
jgi:hypothetical protein